MTNTVKVYQENMETSCCEMVRSGPSIIPVYLRIINRTKKRVDLVWINYKGEGVRYATLLPGHWFDVSTFEGHPWVFRESQSGDKFVGHFLTYVKGRDDPVAVPLEVYYPVAPRPRQRQMARRIVPIYYPNLSLEERSMRAVADQLELSMAVRKKSKKKDGSSDNSVESVEATIKKIPLPKCLQEDLQDYIDQRNLYRTAFAHPDLQYNG